MEKEGGLQLCYKILGLPHLRKSVDVLNEDLQLCPLCIIRSHLVSEK